MVTMWSEAFVAVIDHRRERGRLAGAGGADHQDQAALEHGSSLITSGSPSNRAGHIGGDVAHHHGRVAALIKHVHAETAEPRLGYREIDLPLPLEVLDLPDVISASAAWRTVSGVSTCLFTDRIWPSILILMGALEVKNRSDALRSTISLNNGLVLSVGWRPPATAFTTSVMAGVRPGDLEVLARRRRHVLGHLHRLRPCSSSTILSAPPSSTLFCSRLLSSLMRSRSSFFGEIPGLPELQP